MVGVRALEYFDRSSRMIQHRKLRGFTALDWTDFAYKAGEFVLLFLLSFESHIIEVCYLLSRGHSFHLTNKILITSRAKRFL